MTIEVIPVTATIGAEICGFDPRDPVACEEDFPALLDALHEHEVVFLRDLGLTEDEQMTFGRRFGGISIFPVAKLLGATEPKLTVIRDTEDSPNRADAWHTDVTWTANPPTYALLQAMEVPATGGDTLWASMTAAYEALSGPLQDFLAGLTVVHDNQSFIASTMDKMGDGEASRSLAEALRTHYPPVVHPLVRTHPVTGRRALLWGGRFIRHIVELSETESRTVLDLLRSHIDDARFHVRWKWGPGDLAICDERSTVHRAVGDHWPQVRSVARLEIDGDRPYFDPEATPLAVGSA